MADNTADDSNPDVYGEFNSLGHNLIGDGADSDGWDMSDLVGDDLTPIDPLVGTLGYHGGITQTMLLLSGSPAIDAGTIGYAPSTDQRGFTRISNSTVDIGSVEMQSGETSLSAPYAYSVSFNVALGATLTVTDADDNPNLLDYSGNADDENADVFEVDGEDEDVGVEIETANGGLLTIDSNGDFTYIAPDDFVGDDAVSYTIKSGVSTRSGTITFHITNTSALDASFSMLKNQTLTVSADPQGLLHFGHAASGDPLTVTKVNGSTGNIASSTPTTEGGSVTVQSTGAFVYIPDTDFIGDDTFTFTISDGLSESTATVTIHVTKVLASNATFDTLHDVQLSAPGMVYTESLLDFASDADEDPLTVVEINGDDEAVSEEVATAMGGTLTVESNGNMVYDPPANFAGLDWFTYTVSDGSVTSTAYVFINVNNIAPVATNAGFYVIHDRELSVPGTEVVENLLDSASDGDYDTLEIVAIDGDGEAVGTEVYTTNGGSLTVNANGHFVYMPPANWTGDDTFTYTVSDGITTSTATVTIHVTNTAPSASNVAFYTDENVPLSAPGMIYTAGLLDSASDTDDDVLIIVAINGDDDFEDDEITVVTANGGSVTVNIDGSFVYTPPAKWTGDDTFTFTVWDGITTATATVTIHVT